MSDKSESKSCPKCGAPIPAEAPQGLCPKCLLLQASVPTEAGRAGEGKGAPPSIKEVAAAFPQLEILELVGQGGMGFVFKARQPKLERLVALKILPQMLAGDPAFAERFAREGRVLARLNHPNIVTIHDFGQANGFFYLLMEFVDGVNLRQAMRLGRFTPEQALAVVPKICDALQFAHNEGVLHRDIKPENILLDSRGRVKIADFGIAKLVGAPQDDQTLTASGGTLGTPHYMAPEQIEKPATVDHRADIYSLGVVFYEMLTGELPIGKFQPPSQKVSVDVRLDEVVLHALEKEPARRYQQVGQIKTDVDTIAATPAANIPQEPATTAQTREPRERERAVARPRRSKAVQVGLIVCVITFLVAAVATLLLPNSFRASSRVRLVQVAPAEATGTATYDPYLLQSEFEVIQSGAVLKSVSDRLNLAERWGKRFGDQTSLSSAETITLLAAALDLRPIRNTMLLEIGFFSDQPQEAAEIANGIAESYQAYSEERIKSFLEQRRREAGNSSLRPVARLVQVEIVDRAAVPARPTRPNKPLNIWLGLVFGVALGCLAAGVTACLAWWRKRNPSDGAIKSAAHAPDRFWRRFAVIVLALVTLPVVLAVLAILAAMVIPAIQRERDRAHRTQEFAGKLATISSNVVSDTKGEMIISAEPFTRANPEPSELGWGFKCFLPPDSLATILFVRWDNGVPRVDSGFSAYYKVGKSGGVDIPFCSLSCYPIAESAVAGMTNAENRRMLNSWGFPITSSVTNAVQWNVNLGLGYTSSQWVPMAPYRMAEMALPLKIHPGRQQVLRLVKFVKPEDEGGRAELGVELRIFLEPLRLPAVRTLPDEKDMTGYVAGRGLPWSMTEALDRIKSWPEDPPAIAAAPEAWSPKLGDNEKPDPGKILQEAKDLMAKGKYEDALQRHIWYHEHALEFDSGQSAVRLSFALSDWIELGRRYPKAKEALLEIRDGLMRDFREGRGYSEKFQELSSINQQLQANETTYAIFKEINSNDPQLARQCYYYAEGMLVSKHEYDLCLKLMGDPEHRFQLIRQVFEMEMASQKRMQETRKMTEQRLAAQTNRGLPAPPMLPDNSEMMRRSRNDRYVGQVRQLVEILVGTGHAAQAEAIQGKALALLDDPRLKSAVSDAQKKVGT